MPYSNEEQKKRVWRENKQKKSSTQIDSAVASFFQQNANRRVFNREVKYYLQDNFCWNGSDTQLFYCFRSLRNRGIIRSTGRGEHVFVGQGQPTTPPPDECSFSESPKQVISREDFAILAAEVNRKIRQKTSQPTTQTFEQAKTALGSTITPAAQPQGNEQTSENEPNETETNEVSCSSDDVETLEQAARRREREKQEMLNGLLPGKENSK